MLRADRFIWYSVSLASCDVQGRPPSSPPPPLPASSEPPPQPSVWRRSARTRGASAHLCCESTCVSGICLFALPILFCDAHSAVSILLPQAAVLARRVCRAVVVVCEARSVDHRARMVLLSGPPAEHGHRASCLSVPLATRSPRDRGCTAGHSAKAWVKLIGHRADQGMPHDRPYSRARSQHLVRLLLALALLDVPPARYLRHIVIQVIWCMRPRDVHGVALHI